MVGIYLLITIVSIIVISILIGIIIFKNDQKKSYSFLNMFPFEMQNRNLNILNTIFLICLALGIASMCVSSLYLLFYRDNASFLEKGLSIFLILDAIFTFSLFVVNMRIYKGHILLSSLQMVLTSASLILIGYISIINKDYSNIGTSISSFILGGILLLILLSPLFLSWSKGQKVDETKTTRNKFNILAFSEWISILLEVVIYVILVFTLI